MWQPKLNHPYIVSFLKRSALGFRPNKRIRNTVSSKFGLRLWRKLRKKLHTQLQPEQFQLKRRPAWEILFNLTCFSRAPFEEAKRLRSGRYVPDEIYSLIRLSNCLEEPDKMGLQLRFTSHPSCCSEVSAWIRNRSSATNCLPLFRIREGPHQTLKDFLHNFKEWDAWLQNHSIDDVQCPCSKFAAQLPESCMTHGHVVAGIEQLGCLHHSFEKIGSGRAASAFFPAKHEFFKHNLKMCFSWRRKHCFPQTLESEFRSLLQLQWEKHVQHFEDRLTWKDVSAARSLLHRYFVVHCEDHEPNHLMI